MLDEKLLHEILQKVTTNEMHPAYSERNTDEYSVCLQDITELMSLFYESNLVYRKVRMKKITEMMGYLMYRTKPSYITHLQLTGIQFAESYRNFDTNEKIKLLCSMVASYPKEEVMYLAYWTAIFILLWDEDVVKILTF